MAHGAQTYPRKAMCPAPRSAPRTAPAIPMEIASAGEAGATRPPTSSRQLSCVRHGSTCVPRPSSPRRCGLQGRRGHRFRGRSGNGAQWPLMSLGPLRRPDRGEAVGADALQALAARAAARRRLRRPAAAPWHRRGAPQSPATSAASSPDRQPRVALAAVQWSHAEIRSPSGEDPAGGGRARHALAVVSAPGNSGGGGRRRRALGAHVELIRDPDCAAPPENGCGGKERRGRMAPRDARRQLVTPDPRMPKRPANLRDLGSGAARAHGTPAATTRGFQPARSCSPRTYCRRR